MTMRLAKPPRTVLPLAFWAVLATCALAQDSPNVQPNAARDQLTKQAPVKPQPPSTPNSPAPPPAKPSGPAVAKAPAKSPAKAPEGAKDSAKAPAKAPQAAKGPAKTPAKAPEVAKDSAKTPAKPPVVPKESATAASANPAKPPAEKPAEEKPVVRRDPFDTLLTKARTGNAAPENLPPGKAGLIVETLQINGVVHSPNGMIAIVSNSQQRVYFLRDGDKLYDGSVEKIALDAISFNEIGKDAFGKPLERVVTKRLYPSSGEQQ
jgi:Tfp pilus assembly protein PilP